MSGNFESQLSRSRKKALVKKKVLSGLLISVLALTIFSLRSEASLVDKYLSLGEWVHRSSVASLDYLHELPSSLIIKGGFVAQEVMMDKSDIALTEMPEGLAATGATSGGFFQTIKDFFAFLFDKDNGNVAGEKIIKVEENIQPSSDLANEEKEIVYVYPTTTPIYIEGPKTIVEKITERIITGSGVSADYFEERLLALNNKLQTEIYVVAQNYAGNRVTNVFRDTNITNDIDNLDGATITGELYDGNDSAGSDGYVLQSTGAGVEWVATSTLGFSGGASSQWATLGDDIYYTDGNVGIGTTSPFAKLSVSSALAGTPGMYTENTAAGGYALSVSGTHEDGRGIYSYGGDYGIIAAAASNGAAGLFQVPNLGYGVMISGNTGANAIYSESLNPSYFAGNIGIGTSTPESKLTILATNSSSGNQYAQTVKLSNSGNADFGGRYRAGIKSQVTDSSVYNYGLGYDADGILSDYSFSGSVDSLGDVADVYISGFRSYITASAPTIAPYDSLSLIGFKSFVTSSLGTTGFTSHKGVDISVAGSADSNSGIYIEGVTDGTANYGMYLKGISAADNNFAIYSSAAAKSYFAGNVGIGTTSPYAKLSVSNTASVAADNVSFDSSTLVDAGTLSSGALNITNQKLNTAPSILLTQNILNNPVVSNIYGLDNSIDLSNTDVTASSNRPASLYTYGSKMTVSGSPIFTQNSVSSPGTLISNTYGVHSSIALTPTLAGSGTRANSHTTYAGYFENTTTPIDSSTGVRAANNYGVYSTVNGNLGTLGMQRAGYFYALGTSVANYGLQVGAGGATDNNYGVHIAVSGATNNYGLYLDSSIIENDSDYSIYSAATAQSYFAGNVGVGDTTPDALLDVKGTVCLDINADEACTDNTAALSDSRLKINVNNYENGLEAIRDLRPVWFTWNGEYNTGHSDSLGFIAQEVEEIFPVLVIEDVNGYKNLDYSKLTAVLAKGIQEIDVNLESLALPLDEDKDETFADRFFGRLIQWFADAGNDIGDFFTNRLTTKELCLEDVCIDKEELRNLLENSGGGVVSPTPVPVVTNPEPVADEVVQPVTEPNADVVQDEIVQNEPQSAPLITEDASTDEPVNVGETTEPAIESNQQTSTAESESITENSSDTSEITTTSAESI